MRLRALTPLSLAAGSLACIPLPIPHTVTENATVRAQVVDDRTGEPVPGIHAALGPDGSPETTSDADGRVVIGESEQWRLFWIFPLVPVDSFCGETPLVLDGVSAAGERYRSTSIGTHSCPPGPLLGDTGEPNRGRVDDLGVIRMKTSDEIEGATNDP